MSMNIFVMSLYNEEDQAFNATKTFVSYDTAMRSLHYIMADRAIHMAKYDSHISIKYVAVAKLLDHKEYKAALDLIRVDLPKLSIKITETLLEGHILS